MQLPKAASWMRCAFSEWRPCSWPTGNSYMWLLGTSCVTWSTQELHSCRRSVSPRRLTVLAAWATASMPSETVRTWGFPVWSAGRGPAEEVGPAPAAAACPPCSWGPVLAVLPLRERRPAAQGDRRRVGLQRGLLLPRKG